MTDDLKSQIDSVKDSVSLPDENESIGDSNPDPEPTPGDESGDKEGDRPLKNLQAEFNRKLDKQAREMKQFQTEVLQAIKGTPAKPVESKPEGVKTVRDYTTVELRAMSANPQATPQQRATIEEELQIRTAKEESRRTYYELNRERDIAEARKQATVEALGSYAALSNEESQFYKSVDSELTARRTRYGEHPTDILDAANAVAKRMGIKPSGRYTGGFVAPGRGTSPDPDRTDSETSMGDDKISRISGRLAHALPKGKTFDPKVIKQRAADYERKYGRSE